MIVNERHLVVEYIYVCVTLKSLGDTLMTLKRRAERIKVDCSLQMEETEKALIALRKLFEMDAIHGQ